MVQSTPYGVGINQNGLGDRVPDSACQFGVLKVLSEAASDHVDDASANVRRNERDNLIYYWLSIVVYIAHVVLDTFDLDRERHRAKIILSKSMFLLVLGVVGEMPLASRRLLRSVSRRLGDLALNLSIFNKRWRLSHASKSTGYV